MRIKEIAGICKVSKSTVTRTMKDLQISTIRVGNHIEISNEDAQTIINHLTGNQTAQDGHQNCLKTGFNNPIENDPAAVTIDSEQDKTHHSTSESHQTASQNASQNASRKDKTHQTASENASQSNHDTSQSHQTASETLQNDSERIKSHQTIVYDEKYVHLLETNVERLEMENQRLRDDIEFYKQHIDKLTQINAVNMVKSLPDHEGKKPGFFKRLFSKE